MKYGNVLVTGGAGFLGSQLVKKLLSISEHVHVIDDLSTGNVNALPQSATLTFHRGSITNEELLEQILPEVECIFHLACRNILLSVQDIEGDLHTNLYGGFLLLRKAKECCSHLKRFVYTSTASVYGNAPVIPTPESYFNITLPYSASKFSTEHYCKVFYHMYQVPVTILRLSNVFGPGQLIENPYCGVVAKFFDAVEQGEPLTIYGDGTQTRDFTYVEDVMDVLLRAAWEPGFVGNVYNVGTGRETSVNELAEAISTITGHLSYPTLYKPKRVVDKVYRRAVDVTALQTDVQWTPRYSLTDGLRKTYDWLREGKV
ncbi:NAD-dependent epimerase/dehydratase family protein [Aneurinibacillus terranovensis]|uniref:NAD-dependent epimerase/dehydratase family protein n=1 Tax=Aneurinibacillus terranovensis TaxID=278991 RepID=UPI00040CD262|nr:NAD-dependent epimerase/dehydratase family protein [Aneurinibacillus terranovensis]